MTNDGSSFPRDSPLGRVCWVKGDVEHGEGGGAKRHARGGVEVGATGAACIDELGSNRAGGSSGS